MKPIGIDRFGGTIHVLTLGAILFASGSHAFATSPSSGETDKSASASKINRAYLSSSRAREEFPALLRGAVSESAPQAVTRKSLFVPEPNRALARSPRFLETHPEILRGGKTFALTTTSYVPKAVSRNSAFAASPRAREEFPALQRLPQDQSERGDKVQVAPLK